MQLLTGVTILLLSVIGHTELWVVSVNRFYALRIRATVLRKLRAVHDAAVVGFPFLVLWLAGVGEGGLLTGGTWDTLNPLVRGLLCLTMLGTIPWMLGILRWQLIRKRQFRMADSRTVFDVPAIARTQPGLGDIRGSRRHPSQLWPWNEIYKLEVNTKTVRMNRRAPGTSSSEPLRVVHFSDLHFIDCPGSGFYRFMVQQVIELRPDVIVFTGDLIDRMDLLPVAIEILRPLTAVAPCLFILGNHDWRYDHTAIRKQFAASGWIDVAGDAITIKVKERELLVAGTEMPWLGRPPIVPESPTADARILLSHAPDQLAFAFRHEFDLMLSGHTHGGQVVLPVIGPVYSPSRNGVSLAAGLFQFPKLTLHVSRGIGAKDPLRWRCPPELTCLELQFEA